MTATSLQKRWRIIGAWEMSGVVSAVAKKLKVAANTVRHWVRVWTATGGVDEKEGRGRKPTLGPEAAAEARAMLTDPAMGGARAVAHALQARGTTKKVVSRTTVTRAARGASAKKLAYHRGPPKLGLSPAQMAKRLAFAQANLGRDWGRVMFTDRKKFHLKHPGTRVGRGQYLEQGGRRAVAPRPSRPKAFNIYAGLTLHGLTRAHAVAGSETHRGSFTTKQGTKARNITASQYETVVKDTFLPEGRRLLVRNGVGRWVLQQDNDPTHRAAAGVIGASREGASGRVALLQGWPPCSPDLSPIENVWAILDERVQGKGCTDIRQFEKAVRAELAAFPKAIIKSMYEGMDQRMRDVIAAGGARLQH